MSTRARSGSAAFVLALCVMPGAAMAQRATDNAVTNADDAFGTNVGQESSGIYSENDTRGFSPLKAGNVRIDGIYFDQVATMPYRLRSSTTIRVGFAAEDFPFHAPTGIVDHKFRTLPDKLGLSLGLSSTAFGGYIHEADARIPIVAGHIGLTGGGVISDIQQSDGSSSFGWGSTLRPILRYGGVEFSPFYSIGGFKRSYTRPIYVIRGDTLPDVPKPRTYIGQDWASGHSANHTGGVMIKAALSPSLSLRAGAFTSGGLRKEGYNEIFTLVPGTNQVNHLLIADPVQNVRARSGEAQLAWRFGSGRWQHRLIAGFRARNRLTETGGSDYRNYGLASFGEPDPQPETTFTFGEVNAGRVRQSAFMLGYRGQVQGVGSLNLGVQKARYRATQRDGTTGLVTRQGDDPWLYNVTLGVHLTRHVSLYMGTERGLEDSGIAPDNAVNRNEQLPATRSTQYEGGLRWKFDGGQLAVNAFQISKPYFSFDASGVFASVGTVRHRGLEASLSGRFGPRLSLLAGFLLMQPRVLGPARDAGLLGSKPAGTPSLHARIDGNYRTDLLGGLTPTVSVEYVGKRAVSAAPIATLGDRQLMEGGHLTVDLGVRQQFKVGKVPASFRAVVQNAFDHANWKVVAANTLQMDERRRLTVALAADF